MSRARRPRSPSSRKSCSLTRGRISRQFVEAHADEPEVAALLAEARALAGEPDFDTPRTIRLLQDWIDADKKATPLKTLQGLIWDDGFAPRRTGRRRLCRRAAGAPALARCRHQALRLFVGIGAGAAAGVRLHAVRRPHAAVLRLFRHARRLESSTRRRTASSRRRSTRRLARSCSCPMHIGELDAAQPRPAGARPRSTAARPFCRSGPAIPWCAISPRWTVPGWSRLKPAPPG